MSRPTYRRVPARCICQGGDVGPTTHRAAVHRPDCPHSTLHDTTQGYDQVTKRLNARAAARAARREKEEAARRARQARPASRIHLDDQAD